MNKQTELEYHNEFIMIHGKKINIKDCVMELHQSTFVDPNLFKGPWKWDHYDYTFGEMFIVDDVGKKFNSKL